MIGLGSDFSSMFTLILSNRFIFWGTGIKCSCSIFIGKGKRKIRERARVVKLNKLKCDLVERGE